MAKRENLKESECDHKTDIWYFTVRGDTLFKECFWCKIKSIYKIKPKKNRRTHTQVVLDERNQKMEKQECGAVKSVKQEVKQDALRTKSQNRRKVRRSKTYRRKSGGRGKKNRRRN